MGRFASIRQYRPSGRDEAAVRRLHQLFKRSGRPRFVTAYRDLLHAFPIDQTWA